MDNAAIRCVRADTVSLPTLLGPEAVDAACPSPIAPADGAEGSVISSKGEKTPVGAVADIPDGTLVLDLELILAAREVTVNWSEPS